MANAFCFIAGLYSLFSNLCSYMDLINLSNYNYPSSKDSELTYIPIFATTDMHGYAFTRKVLDNNYGGVSLQYSFLEVLRREWGDRLLYFDSGDKFQGGVESTFSNGSIMSQFYNFAKLDLSVLGNHEFDNTLEFLKDKLTEINSTCLTTNLYSVETKEYLQLPHSQKSKIFELQGGIRIGVIGYTPDYKYSDETYKVIEFKKFEVIIEEAKRLKELKDAGKIDAIILMIHEGLLYCKDITFDINVFFNKTKRQYKDHCRGTALTDLLEGEGKDLIDAVVGGHVHQPGYYWVNDIPIVHSSDKGRYFQLLYLPFKERTLVKDKIVIEGPVPVCERISEKTKRCEFSDRKDKMYYYYYHNYLIRFNKEVQEKVLKQYEAEMNKYNEYVCTNNIQNLTRGVSENPLGNLLCDILRTQVKANVAVLNNGCFRSTWNEGELYVEHIFDMNPFKNTIVTFDMTGEELTTLMRQFLMKDLSKYQSGGLLMIFKKGEMISLTTMTNESIKKDKLYKVTSHNHFFTSKEYNEMKNKGLYIEKNIEDHGLMTTIVTQGLKEIKEINEQDFWESDPMKRRVVILNEDNENDITDLD